MENEVQPSDVTQPQKSNGGLSWEGLVKVFYAPAEFFGKLKDNPKVLVPWLVYFVLVLITMFLIGDLAAKMQLDITQEMMARQGITDLSKMPTLEQIRMQVIWTGSIMMMLAPLLAGALGLFWGNVVMAGKARFKQLLSVMLYGEILFWLGHLIIIIPLILIKGSLRVSISLAALLKETPMHNWLYVAASKIGFFYVWEMIAIGIGLSIVYGFVRNKGYLLAVLSMGMISVLHVLMTLIMGAMF